MAAGDMRYAQGKLRTAIVQLAAGSGDIHDRLREPCMNLKSRIGLEDFPAEVAEEFRSLSAEIDALDSMNDGRAFALAKLIVDIEEHLASAVYAQDDSEHEYAQEKFLLATQSMATSGAPLRQRIHEAYESIVAVQEGDLPESIRSVYRALLTRMTWKTWGNDGGEGTIAATLARVSDDECRELIGLMFDVHAGLAYAELKSAKGGE